MVIKEINVNATTINIKGVGPVLFEPSKRAKRVSISVKPFKGVRVAVPRGVSLKKAVQFAQTRADWIHIHREKMKHMRGRVTFVAALLMA